MWAPCPEIAQISLFLRRMHICFSFLAIYEISQDKLNEQSALGLDLAWVELLQLGVEQVVEEERAVFTAVGWFRHC
jgi:hypothetical protein